jgi:hypothetical protein
MITVSLVVSSVLALVLLASSVMKFRRAPAVVATLVPLGVPERAIPGLGILELAATLGLFAGLFWWPLGAAAAVGSALYFVGAVVTHLRARDYVIAPAAVLLLASVAALALILASS